MIGPARESLANTTHAPTNWPLKKIPEELAQACGIIHRKRFIMWSCADICADLVSTPLWLLLFARNIIDTQK